MHMSRYYIYRRVHMYLCIFSHLFGGKWDVSRTWCIYFKIAVVFIKSKLYICILFCLFLDILLASKYKWLWNCHFFTFRVSISKALYIQQFTFNLIYFTYKNRLISMSLYTIRKSRFREVQAQIVDWELGLNLCLPLNDYQHFLCKLFSPCFSWFKMLHTAQFNLDSYHFYISFQRFYIFMFPSYN